MPIPLRLRACVIAVFLLAISTPRLAVAQLGPWLLEGSQHPHLIYFEDEIQAYLEQDMVSPPPRDAIIFVGSSIFLRWTNLAQHMAPLPVYNRAFGGARTWEVLHYIDKIVIPYEPRIIVYYCGSNDIEGGESAPAIFDRFRQFVERVGDALSNTRVFFVSINRAPNKKNRWDIVDAANALIEMYANSTPIVDYIDVNPILFDTTGEPREELYLDDDLHFTPHAYDELAGFIKPILFRAYYAD